MTTKGLSQVEKIDTLTKVGFTPAEIANLIGTTSNTVSVTINQLKKNKKK